MVPRDYQGYDFMSSWCTDVDENWKEDESLLERFG